MGTVFVYIYHIKIVCFKETEEMVLWKPFYNVMI